MAGVKQGFAETLQEQLKTYYWQQRGFVHSTNIFETTLCFFYRNLRTVSTPTLTGKNENTRMKIENNVQSD